MYRIPNLHLSRILSNEEVRRNQATLCLVIKSPESFYPLCLHPQCLVYIFVSLFAHRILIEVTQNHSTKVRHLCFRFRSSIDSIWQGLH